MKLTAAQYTLKNEINCGINVYIIIVLLLQITEVYLLPLASKKQKQTKNKVKDLTSKLGTRMETGRLRRDLLGLRIEQPPGLLFNGII